MAKTNPQPDNTPSDFSEAITSILWRSRFGKAIILIVCVAGGVVGLWATMPEAAKLRLLERLRLMPAEEPFAQGMTAREDTSRVKRKDSIASAGSTSVSGQTVGDTVVLIVRHAEKSESPPDNPALSEIGRTRAESLARFLAKAGINAIYATQYRRTQETVEPTAKALNLNVTLFDAAQSEELSKQILEQHQGGVVLIAGHSNTVPELVKAFGGSIGSISEADYDDLFAVYVSKTGNTRVVQWQYGYGP